MTTVPTPETLPQYAAAAEADAKTIAAQTAQDALAVLQRRGYTTTEFWTLLGGAAVAYVGTKVSFLGTAEWQQILTAAVPVATGAAFAWFRTLQKNRVVHFVQSYF